MGVSAKAILYGTITPVQVGAALDRAGYRNEPLGADREHTRLWVYPPDGSDRRTLWVFGPGTCETDNVDVYAGERTQCSLGAHTDGPEIVRILAEEFGGFHQSSDATDDWTSVDGRNQVELTPTEALHVAFHRSLPPDLALGASRAVETDPEKLVLLRDAIDGYLASLDASPRP